MNDNWLDYSDITDIFKEKLHVDNLVKKISSIFLNKRYSEKINYKPYFQRNYVWDSEKASYFIESILLGTDIPPLVFFQTRLQNEVIDGRQRYETIERFLADKFALNENGLHSLKTLAGKRYSQLDSEIKEQFEETRIRILQFKVVNEPRLEIEKEDKIKKEIFRRYNSGITSLDKAEIERAAYINDPISKYFYSKISADEELLSMLVSFFLPVRKRKASRRDQINYLIMQSRTLLSVPYIPIYSYARSSSKQEVVKRYYNAKMEGKNPDDVYNRFYEIIQKLKMLDSMFKKENFFLKGSKLFYEVAFWGTDILISNGFKLSDKDIINIAFTIIRKGEKDKYWVRILNNPTKDLKVLFDPTGSHYYSSTNNRYNYIANVLNDLFDMDFSKYLKNTDDFNHIMSTETELEEYTHYRLNKPLPESLSIEDIISDMNKDKFMIRPEYQRSEVKNIQKASYLMESILLGIKVPPIFVYKREDKVKEVIDGQQRLLTILGFLGESYKDENGEITKSNKDCFKLSKLKILKELNGLDIHTISDDFKEKILEFQLDVIEIDYDTNPEFSQTDLFARLNTKPYPIKENTFEMWNAYIDKDIILKIKEIATLYENVIFKAKDTRMKVEELVTSLAYLDYRLSNKEVQLRHVLNVYKKNGKFCARMTSKETVTNTLGDVSKNGTEIFIKSVQSVDDFAKKVNCLIESNPMKLKELFSHSRKGTQYKTDQNYYFLWAMLRNLKLRDIQLNTKCIFQAASEMFNLIQKSPEDYSAEMFFDNLDKFNINMISICDIK